MMQVMLIVKCMDTTIEEILDINMKKLKVRYGGSKFVEDKALNRDLKKERKVLDGNYND